MREVARADVAEAATALGAVPAGDHPCTGHVIAHLDPGDPRTNGFDDAGALVPGHQRLGNLDAAHGHAQVAVAITRVGVLDEDLPLLGGLQLQLLDAVALLHLSQDRSSDLHALFPLRDRFPGRTPRTLRLRGRSLHPRRTPGAFVKRKARRPQELAPGHMSTSQEACGSSRTEGAPPDLRHPNARRGRWANLNNRARRCQRCAGRVRTSGPAVPVCSHYSPTSLPL